jgi:hypothetical protein
LLHIQLIKIKTRAIYYLPGKDNYWFYNHVRRQYSEYDFFSIDLPGFGFNADYTTGLYTYTNFNGEKFTQPNNYFDDMDFVFKMLNQVLMDLKTNQNLSYEINDLMGFSTGGFIGLHHVWKLQTLKSSKKDSDSNFQINNLLLISPLTRFYYDPDYMNILLHLLNDFISPFDSKFNYGIYRSKNNSYSDKINLLLKSIYEYESKSKSKPKPKPKSIDIRNVLSNDDNSITSGFITTIEKTIQKMINSSTKIEIPVKMVCSSEYDPSDSLYNMDSLLKPEYK